MRSVNKVILIGNLTRDPELRQTPNGQDVTTFGLATNREWTTKDGQRNNSAEFHECVAWAHLAEICQKFLKKGNLIYVEGYLKTRSWDSPEGVKKFKTEIVVQDMIRLEKRPPETQESRSAVPVVPAAGVTSGVEAEAQSPSSPSPISDAPPPPEDEPLPPSEESAIEKDLGL